jgi:large subunit ribosomal protein L6
MSKIGKLPIPIPQGVKVDIATGEVRVSGPKGNLAQKVSEDMKIEIVDDQVVVTRPSDQGTHRALHGLTRSLIYNMVAGVSEGFKKTLEMVGIGYRAELKGKILELFLGYSHPVLLAPPEGIEIEVIPKENKIIVSGIDKQLVGQTAAEIRKLRPPEPYKGKGIRYEGERIRRKAGKAAAGAGA